MAERNIYRGISIKEALRIVTHDLNRKGTKEEILNRIGPEMYNKLCVLGYIAQGISYNSDTGSPVQVWKLTGKPNLFDEISREPDARERRLGSAIAQLTL